jgi:hypothetical protein
VSDFQQGPDWWLASDGKWYPPQSRPAPLPPPTPTPAPTSVPPAPWTPLPLPQSPVQPYVQARATVSPHLGGWLQGLIWASAALALALAALTIAALSAFNRLESRRVVASGAFGDWIDLLEARDTVGGFLTFVWLAAFVLLLVWMNKAHKATQTLFHGHRNWTSGWTIGGWFIPAANVVIPMLVLSEIERIAGTLRTPPSGTVVGNLRSSSAIGWLWWIGLVLGLTALVVGAVIGDTLFASADDIRAGYVLEAIGFLSIAIAWPLGAVHVRRIGRRLSAAGIVEIP